MAFLKVKTCVLIRLPRANLCAGNLKRAQMTACKLSVQLCKSLMAVASYFGPRIRAIAKINAAFFQSAAPLKQNSSQRLHTSNGLSA
jgi:hypothetical protein